MKGWGEGEMLPEVENLIGVICRGAGSYRRETLEDTDASRQEVIAVFQCLL